MDAFDELLENWGPVAEPETPAPARPVIAEDKIAGMMLGLALGDALGAPHEFLNQVPLSRYTGMLIHPVTLFRRFQGGMLIGQVAQITDDTEMAIALSYSIVRAGGYRPDVAAAEYLAWAQSMPMFIGNNTRALFAGLRSVKGYRARRAALLAQPAVSHSQSNGCLMRAAPLAVLGEGAVDAAEQDCLLTNFHTNCVVSVRAYVRALRVLLMGGTPAAAVREALEESRVNATVHAVIEAASRRQPRAVDHRPTKGWVLQGLHCAFYALTMESPEYQDRIDTVVRFGGDTDTNAAIAGAMLGAHLGVAEMRTENRTGPNIDAVLAIDASRSELGRPTRYGAARLPRLIEQLTTVAEANR